MLSRYLYLVNSLALVHALPIVLVGIGAQCLDGAIGAQEGYPGVRDAIEHRCLDGRIVEHILEDDLLPDL